jgi:hypothetical protein
VLGDQYAAEAFREVMRRESLSYDERTFTAQSKPDLYASLKDAVVSQREPDHVTDRFQFECYAASAAPTDGETVGRVELGYLALHAMLLAELLFGRFARVFHQLIVAPVQPRRQHADPSALRLATAGASRFL